MSNMVREVGNKFIRFIIVIWPMAALLVAASFVLMIEDYMTTYHGYLLIPTEKVNKELVPWIVAIVPQAGQIVLFYLYSTDTTKVWASKVALFLFFADSATDVFQKLDGQWQGFPMLAIAITETIVIFTIGSEFLFTICLAFCAETFGEFVASAGAVLDNTTKGFLSLAGVNPPNRQQQNRQQQNRQQQKGRQQKGGQSR